MKQTEIDAFKNALKTKKMKLQYLKKTGDLREAEGTTNLELMPDVEQGKIRKERKKAPGVIRYYDFGKKQWRSFHESRLVDFEEV